MIKIGIRNSEQNLVDRLRIDIDVSPDKVYIFGFFDFSSVISSREI